MGKPLQRPSGGSRFVVRHIASINVAAETHANMKRYGTTGHTAWNVHEVPIGESQGRGL